MLFYNWNVEFLNHCVWDLTTGAAVAIASVGRRAARAGDVRDTGPRAAHVAVSGRAPVGHLWEQRTSARSRRVQWARGRRTRGSRAKPQGRPARREPRGPRVRHRLLSRAPVRRRHRTTGARRGARLVPCHHSLSAAAFTFVFVFGAAAAAAADVLHSASLVPVDTYGTRRRRILHIQRNRIVRRRVLRFSTRLELGVRLLDCIAFYAHLV